MIDSPISIRWGDVSYHGPNDVESNLISIRESLYVKTLINKLFEKQRLYNLKMGEGSNF